LTPQIHGISNETHQQIHTPLTVHQYELKKAMQRREDDAQENTIRSAHGNAAEAIYFGPLILLTNGRSALSVSG
jgi:hypothetical protein